MIKLLSNIILFFAISCINVSYFYSHKDNWNGDFDEFVSVEIFDVQRNNYISLSEDGMICRSPDSIGIRRIIFLDYFELDSNALFKVQNFLMKNKMLDNLEGRIDGPIYTPQFCAQFILSKYRYMKIVRISDFTLCEKKLNVLVDLINDLIPKEYNEYKLISYDIEMIKNCK